MYIKNYFYTYLHDLVYFLNWNYNSKEYIEMEISLSYYVFAMKWWKYEFFWGK